MVAYQDIRDRLRRIGQEHMLRFHDRLSTERQRALLASLAGIDLEQVPGLVERYVLRFRPPDPPADIEPPACYARRAEGERVLDEARRAGEDLLRAGRIAAFTVAGGQGTRLGFDGPKGCVPAGAVSGKPLFQIFAEGLLAARRRYGAPVPWYVMTSPQNHEPTIAFFRRHGHFGLPTGDITFLPQGVMPTLDRERGLMLLDQPWAPATNPDGHGGSFRALMVSGALPDMRRRGVRHVSYFQVDNPLVRVIDPVFIGLHAGAPDSSAEMSSKMVAKAYPEEKVGLFCRVGGRLEMVEYSDLPMDRQRERGPDGSLRFQAGNPAIHMLGVDFVERVSTDPGFALPFHRAVKRVPFVDLNSAERVEPAEPNAVKLERFVFDALPLCRSSVILETDREEFAPIKNATGIDSAETSRDLQTARAARWLEEAGIEVPRARDGRPDCTLEISPLTATEPQDLRGRDLPRRIERGARLAL
jgi:UDP-N-acetylglucosamine/UDP-N-acetylgalactosamine diphosphorylase